MLVEKYQIQILLTIPEQIREEKMFQNNVLIIFTILYLYSTKSELLPFRKFLPLNFKKFIADKYDYKIANNSYNYCTVLWSVLLKPSLFDIFYYINSAGNKRAFKMWLFAYP